MLRTKWFALWVACGALAMVSGCIDKDKVTGPEEEIYSDNVTGDWRFYGAVNGNECDVFSFIRFGSPLDLRLHLDQDSQGRITGRKIGGGLWSEVQPMERATVSGTYEDNVVSLTPQFVNQQPVIPPQFTYPAGVDTSYCLLALSGTVEFTLSSAVSATGVIVVAVNRDESGGQCDPWIDVPCKMFISGMWNKM